MENFLISLTITTIDTDHQKRYIIGKIDIRLILLSLLLIFSSERLMRINIINISW